LAYFSTEHFWLGRVPKRSQRKTFGDCWCETSYRQDTLPVTYRQRHTTEQQTNCTISFSQYFSHNVFYFLNFWYADTQTALKHLQNCTPLLMTTVSLHYVVKCNTHQPVHCHSNDSFKSRDKLHSYDITQQHLITDVQSVRLRLWQTMLMWPTHPPIYATF